MRKRLHKYALKTVDTLTRRSIQILEFPWSGRKVPEFEEESIREIIEYPYRLIYKIKENQIDVLSVVHGSRNLARDLL